MEQVAHAVEQARADVLGPRLAEDVVTMTAGAGIRLDYAPDSLALIDRIIDGLRRTRPSTGGPVPPALRGFGAYAGEVLHRRAGAAWVDFDAAQREMFGQPFGIRTADGRVWNPLGKAVKRYQAGTAESLQLFHLAVVGRARA